MKLSLLLRLLRWLRLLLLLLRRLLLLGMRFCSLLARGLGWIKGSCLEVFKAAPLRCRCLPFVRLPRGIIHQGKQVVHVTGALPVLQRLEILGSVVQQRNDSATRGAGVETTGEKMECTSRPEKRQGLANDKKWCTMTGPPAGNGCT